MTITQSQDRDQKYRRLMKYVGVERGEGYLTLSDHERRIVDQLNRELRMFGWGPYSAYIADSATDAEMIKLFVMPSMRSAEGSALVVRSALHIMFRSRSGSSDPRLEPLFKKARAYDLSVVELQDVLARDELQGLDPRSTRIAVRNKRGQLVYTS